MKKHFLAVAFAVASVGAAQAGGNHAPSHDYDMASTAKHGHAEAEVSHKSREMFWEKRSVDGYEVSFHVMKAKPGLEHGGSHNVMLRVEKDGEVLDNVVINSKVIHPNGDADIKPLMKMGDWFMNGYDLGHEGRHQLLVLFRTPEGEKHKAGVYYSDE